VVSRKHSEPDLWPASNRIGHLLKVHMNRKQETLLNGNFRFTSGASAPKFRGTLAKRPHKCLRYKERIRRFLTSKVKIWKVFQRNNIIGQIHPIKIQS